MDLLSYIKNSKNKTFTRRELMEAAGCSNDEQLYRLISEYTGSGNIEAVKSSGTNGNRKYPLYEKYRRTVKKDYGRQLNEIYALNPLLIKNRYLINNPDRFEKYEKQIKLLSDYLSHLNDLSIPVSRKERSFEVFGEEKMLDDTAFSRFLERTGADRTVLGWYDTPEYCFLEYIPVRHECMTVLICENKDIWFNIRRMMYEYNRSVLFGVHIDGVIYGDGNKVCADSALTFYNRFICCSNAKYYYWGDIDREGIRIAERTAKVNPDLDISPFRPAYEKMLELAENVTLPDSTDMREVSVETEFISRSFDSDAACAITALLESNKRLPQEIISFRYLYTNMK